MINIYYKLRSHLTLTIIAGIYFLLVSNDMASAQTTTFNYTGAVQTYLVPSGVTRIAVDVTGAGGGSSYNNSGGYGGHSHGEITVTPGTIINVYAGGAGHNGSSSTSGLGTGGWNGGGSSSTTYGGGGGGASDIRIGGTALSNRVIVSGGGGGGGYNYGAHYEQGGNGGGLTGGYGFCYAFNYTSYSGQPGTQSGGGAAGTNGGASAGTSGTGGSVTSHYGGGGGGGYYGGGGGSYGGGGGGSSFADPAYVTSFATTKGYGFNSYMGYIPKNGKVLITPALTASGAVVFGYTGSVQTYIVPSGVTSVNVDVVGAPGGKSHYYYGKGGAGGRVQCTMAVVPGQTYYIYAGGAGENGFSYNSSARAGGWNGGGNGHYYGGAGGGASDIRFGGTAISNRIIVAGGGGGASYSGASYYGQNGGAGGGLTGEHGFYYFGAYACYTATGGTQSGGGNNGTCMGGSASTQGSGVSASSYYSGGGGGYWGGGAGYSTGGAGGGSSYPAGNGGAISGLVHTQGYNHSDDGKIIITPITTPVVKSPTAFTYTGSIQTYTVPTGVTYISIDAAGASGGKGYYYYSGVPGCGGRVRCNLAVTAGQVYYILSGGRGSDGDPGVTNAPGGWNGGGHGGTSGYSAGGGGATDIRLGGTAISNRIIVAGGGGGSAYPGSSTAPGTYCGGDGGGLTGAFGTYQYYVNHATYSGQGGNQSSGGNNGTGTGGSASTKGSGSNAASGYGAGGGGGYWGGGCGYYGSSNNVGGGGGGSSYPASAGGNVSSLVHNQGYNCNADGYCIITPIDPPTTATTGTSFAYTGSIQTYTVPTGITTIQVDVNGASGGNGFTSGGKGGCGAQVTCDVAVSPGQVLYLYTGGKGANGTNSVQAAGGWNGGANSYSTYGGAGGGASDIRTGGTAISNRIVVAGGGGGGGTGGSSTTTMYYFAYSGGHGGGVSGGNGWYAGYYYMPYSPTGGTQSGGGINGTSWGGSATTQGSGNPGYSSYSAGGGGGYWGGGGAYMYSGGGGGSSYTSPSVTGSVIYTDGANCKNNGVITITPQCTAGRIAGTSNACVGYTTALTDVVSGGAWTSNNTAVATVSSTGVVTGVSAGTATISYGGVLACGTVYTTMDVTIVSVPASITSPGYLCQSIVTTLSSSGGGLWSSSNTSVATVNAGTGDALGISAGTVTITYAVGGTSGCYVAQTLTVNPTAPVTGPTTVCPATTITLSDALSGGTWTSSNTSFATIDPSTGVLTGVSAGSPVITYTLPSGCARSYNITAYPSPNAITGNVPVCVGLAITLSETSSGGTWSSSNTSQAKISSSGVVTAVSGLSNPVITYTLPTTCIAVTTLTVNPLPVPISIPFGTCVTDPVNPVVTLVDGSTGGNWTSSNTSVATVVSFSGELTGLTLGTSVITYTLPTGCLITTPVTIYPTPPAIGGTKVVCANAVTYLSNTAIGGVWSSSNNTLATVGSGTGIVTGISGFGTPTISYTSVHGCLAISTVTVNTAPGSIVGTRVVCVGSTTGLVVGGGGTWSSSNPGIGSVTPGPGAGGGVITGVFAGNPVITYTLPVTGCFSTTPVTVNPTPAAITGDPNVCYGLTTTLNDATPGGVWSSSTITVATVSGSGLVSASGVPSGTTDVNYSFATGCKASVTVTVNPLPVIYTLNQPGGTTDYCAGGAGLDLQMNVSTTGVNYQLYNSGVAVGTAVGGTGSILDFGNQTAGGTYTAIASDAVTGCVSNMAGSAVVNVDPVPTIYTLNYAGSSSSYCDGSAGVDMCMNNSQPGFYYSLYINGSPGTVVIGTGSAVCFGPQTTVGVYNVVATDPVTGCNSMMAGAVTVGKNLRPDVYNVTVSNGGNYCAGGAGVHIGLDFANTGVNYSLYNGGTFVTTVAGANSSLDFGLQTVAGTYTVVAVNALTGCQNNMAGSAVVSILPLPDPHVVQVVAGGSSNYCIGGTGVHIELDGSDAGVNYQLFDLGTSVGASVSGTGSPIDLGYQTTTGTYNVLATDGASGCSVYMTSSVAVAIYPALTVYAVSVSGTGHFCQGGPGLHVNLSGSTPTIKYDLWNGGVVVATEIGTGGPLDFGLQTVAGAYTVTATSTNGCMADMTGAPAIVIDILPVGHNVTVTNGGSYCAGSTGADIGLTFSEPGISYQLYNGAVAVGSPVTGSSSALDFGIFTTIGAYTVIGTNMTTTCAGNMIGSAVVAVNPQPTGYTVTGGGSYCTGTTTGVPVGLTNSDAAINYQLFNNGTAVGSALSGTGAAISFGNQVTPGLYTIVATDMATGCINSMSGSKVVTIDPLPVVYDVTGGGNYCYGGTGYHVNLSNSTTGVDYTLYNGTIVKTVHGANGTPIDFGLQTAAGSYSVVANTVISGCSENMNGSATINVDPLPNVYSIGGGGGYCTGDAGPNIYLSGSEPGMLYQLFYGGSAAGSPVSGTGLKLDMGKEVLTGTYTIVGYNAATGCNADMAGSTTVSLNASPIAYTVTGGGTFCGGGAGAHIYLSGSQTGTDYQLMNSGVTAGSPMRGTGAALDLGTQTTAGTYNVIASNLSTGCESSMVGSGLITIEPMPVPFTVTGGGNYCSGGTGVAVGVAGSEPGVNYQLYDNGAAVDMPVGGTGTLITFGAQTGAGRYTVTATNMSTTCADTMTGSTLVVVDSLVTPSVAITGTDGIACIGDTVTYTAIPTLGGSLPIYTWSVGGIKMGTGNVFRTIPISGDIVSVKMTSDVKCASSPAVTGSVIMSTLPYVMPSATVSVDPGTSVCTGTTVNMTTTFTNGGIKPDFAWIKNGVVLADAGTTYSYTPVGGDNGDVIIFRLHSNYRCRMADTIFSNPVTMFVDVAEVPDFVITTHLGPVLVGQVDTFIATVKNTGKATFTYQWYVEGTMVPGETLPIFVNHNVYDNDRVSCAVTRTGACGDQSATRETTVVLKNLATQQAPVTLADISVVPNPNKGEFTVMGTLGTTRDVDMSVEITNMLGQVIYTGHVVAHSGSLSEHIKLSNTVPNGMYLLNLRSDMASNQFHIVVEQ